MSDNPYMQALVYGLKEIADLAAQEEELENQQRKLFEELLGKRMAITALGLMIGKEGEALLEEHSHLFPMSFTPDVGLTDAVRDILKDRGKWIGLTPIEVRDYLKKRRFDVDRYSNPLASIHTVLKRLYDADQAELDVSMDNKVAYKWKETPQAEERPKATKKKVASAVVRKAVKVKGK